VPLTALWWGLQSVHRSGHQLVPTLGCLSELQTVMLWVPLLVVRTEQLLVTS
jgi:hypothetical protein